MRIRRLIVLLIVLALAAAGLLLVFNLNDGSGSTGSAGYTIRINEVMTSNKGAVPDANGSFPDWVEVHNTSDTDIDISGYGLSDDKLVAAKWVFPNGSILPAGGFLVVYCSGDASEGPMHAGFKLSKDDELILTNASGQAIDSLALSAVGSNNTLGRDASGNWVEFMSPSPGFPNTDEGAAAYRESMQANVVDNGVRINEFMASNATTLPGPHGDYPDWIELYNTTDTDVDLTGCGLSDSMDRPMKWVFPEGSTISAHGVLLVYCSGRDGLIDGELHAPFGLRAFAEDVVLAGPNGAIIDSYSYTNQEADISMARIPDGTGDWIKNAQPSPGYPNNEAGFAAHMSAHALPRGDIILSEALLNNVSALEVNGDYPDWIEIHNRGSAPLSLGGYALSDNPKNPAKWVFPEMDIAPGDYLVVLATGNNVRDPEKKNLETNFGLSKTGEVVLLFSPAGELLDKLQLKNAGADISYGRSGGELRYFDTPTPGAANAGGFAGFAAQPVLEQMPGVYDESLQLSITAEAGARIHYTTDSTKPTANSPQYTGPISLSSNTVIRAIAVTEGYLSAAPVTGTYLFTADNVNHSLPIATLVLEPDDLWDSKKGIYAFGENYDPDLSNPDIGDSLLSANWYQGRGMQGEEIQTAWERDATFAIFDDAGRQVFIQDVATRIAGAYGRGRAQKGFTVIARSEYGSNRMAYPFFEDRPFTEYKSLVLRAGAQDQNRSKIRDELATAILQDIDVNFLYQAYKPYVLYLNGEYWGTYFLKEKRSRFFVAAHEGVEDTYNMDILKGSATKNWLISHGSNAEWLELTAYVKGHDLSSQSAFDHVANIMDTDSFMDYMICEIYTGNTDTGNYQYYKLPGGKFKWIYYDFCWGFLSASTNTLANRRGAAPAGSDLFNALLKNQGWREKFLHRFAELLNTAFTPERIGPMIDELYAIVEPEIAREREKFNGDTFLGVTQRSEAKGNYEGFIKEIERVRTFVNDRPAQLKKFIQAEFNLSDSYMQEVFG